MPSIEARLGRKREQLEQHERDGERLRDERDDLVREAVEAGLTYREIAELAGLSHQRVSQIANE